MTITTDNGFASAVQALTEALRAACNDPADAVRLLASLAAYDPAAPSATAPISVGIATVDSCMVQLFRRAALTSLARACADYQPSSFDDAQVVCAMVAAVYDAEMLVAADALEDASYQALRTLRAAVLNDLITRGADLARLATITSPVPRPSLAVAYRLYRDATRSDDLIARADPVHPAFMPTSFQALSS